MRVRRAPVWEEKEREEMRTSDEGEGRRHLDGLRERERRRLNGLRERMSENETLAALYILSAISGRLWAIWAFRLG
jgi:hypothetical protein